MSILKNGETGTIICGGCETKFHIANKNSLIPEAEEIKDITCADCIELINNIKFDGTLTIFKIEQ